MRSTWMQSLHWGLLAMSTVATKVPGCFPSPGARSLAPDASSTDRLEIAQPHQVVYREREHEHPADAALAPMPRLAHQAHGLQPAEHLLHQLPLPLAHRITRVSCRPTVDGPVLRL